jgi:uncharacterized phage-associated protein
VFPKTRKIDFDKVPELGEPRFNEISRDSTVTNICNKIIDTFASFSAGQLSKWSHSDGGPWHLTTQQSGFKWNNIIPDELIKNYGAVLAKR